jgi:hypothetical protein
MGEVLFSYYGPFSGSGYWLSAPQDLRIHYISVAIASFKLPVFFKLIYLFYLTDESHVYSCVYQYICSVKDWSQFVSA